MFTDPADVDSMVRAVKISRELHAQAPLRERDAGERVLAAYLAQHLETTERALMIAANSDDADGTARELAQQLVASNRLYANAAQRANRPR